MINIVGRDARQSIRSAPSWMVVAGPAVRLLQPRFAVKASSPVSQDGDPAASIRTLAAWRGQAFLMTS
jgi:hypothetical protein